MIRKLLLAALCLVLYTSALAQESSCGDGIDNDGDGFIDCFDGDCAKNTICKDFYIGQDKACQVPPTGTLNFGMKLEASSPNRITYTSGRMAVGDLDGDGIPEMVTLHQEDKKLYILNGTDLSIKYTGTITGTAEYYDHTIGDVKGDGCGDIFIAEKIGSDFYITSYDCKGLKQWSTKAYGQPITMGLADFGSDGKAEIYYRNEILDAETGTRIVKGSGDWTTIDAGPVAVDILSTTDCASCSGLELVLGGTIYSVNLGARTTDAGSLTLVKSIPAAASYYPKKSSFGFITSLTSVADYNQDGSLDVLTSGSTGSTTGTTHAFFWDVKNNTYKRYATSNNWPEGTGRLNISDIDGDGKLNTTFVSGSRLFALKEDFTLLWSVAISEGTSGYTGATVFDFNNDKSNEIVYRDEGYLYIINGKTGAIFTQAICRSRTANDYPIVVDVDGDGSTEICVTCATSNTDNINDFTRAPFGQIRTYSSSLEAWVPSRKVWNQHGYFNVNINDDLTIPQVQQKHHLVFSTGSPCNPGDNRPLNSFLNQSPFLDSKGCPTYASPDLVFDPSSTITINKPTCPDKDFTISFSIKNSGNLGLSGSLPITFYSGDPRVAGATKLNTVYVNLSNLLIGDSYVANNLTVQGTGANFTLYIALNDNGSTTPLTFPNTNFKECDYTNNIKSATVSPNPFTIETALISNNMKCSANTTAPSGAVEAYRLVSGVKQTADYTFYWYNGATTGDIASANYVGSTYSGLTEGTYSVYAIHKGLLCGSSSKSINVGVTTKSISVAIVEDRAYTNCKNPNGKLHAIVNGGEPAGNFTYAWYAGPNVLTGTVLSVSHELSNLDGLTYSVLVTDKITGCQSTQTGHVTDQTVKPAVTVTTTDANCVPANSGSASAKVGGVTTGYTFNWYIGSNVKPSADYTGPTYSSLNPGTYLVTATNSTTECVSPSVLVTINSKSIQPVTATATAQQTSCSSTPNGAASANIAGVTAGYTWKWFKGNNTLPANQIGTAATVSGLAAGVYTVQATDVAGCSDTETVTIVDNITNPTVSTVINSHQVKCSPADGSITASANGSAGPFRYYWFNGNVGTPDTTAANYKGATYTGLAAGYYTVVAVDRTTRCASAKAAVEILNNTVLPTVATSTVNQTSCDINTPNGQASATIGGVTTGYTFTWYIGSGTGGTVKGNTATITGLAAGTYTVRAVSTSTGCANTAQVSVVNSPVNPTVTAVVDAHQTNCSAGNGTVSANVGGTTTGYTFYWFIGNIASPNIAAPDFTGAVYSGRTAGAYTVVAVSTATKCQSPKATVTVNNNSVAPVITTATVNQTSCDTTTPNGQASANVSGVTAGYTFTWYAGSGTGGTVKSNNAIASGLAAGVYTVKVDNNTTGCSNTAQVTIIDNLVTPTVTAVVDAHQTICSAGNGQVSASVGGNTTNYTFYWFIGNIATPNIATPDFTGAVYSGRTANAYTVVAVSNTTKCPSAKATVTVNNNTVAPVITTSTVNQTSCDGLASNGQASANVGGITAGYTFTWYVGSGTSGAVKGNTATVTGLTSGTYTVKVDNKTTGCSNTAQVTITNSPVNPVVTAAVDAHQTVCNAGNGQVSANVAGNTTDYTFYWFIGNIATPNIATPDFTGAVYSGRTAGAYTVVAVSNATKCQSAKATVTVLNNSVAPVIATTTVNQTSCDTSTPNGQASATVGGVTAGYTFTWYAGAGTSGIIKGNAALATGLAAGVYTVKVDNNTTGCTSTAQVTITDNLVNPVVTAAVDAHQTVCSAGNGQVSASVGGNITNYTFYWFNGNIATPNIAAPDFTGAVYSGRTAGAYTVVAVSNNSKCPSAKATVTVNNNSVAPVITTATVNQTSCDTNTPNGQASANVGGTTTGYTFTWYVGSGTSGTVKGNTALISNLVAGTYTVKVDNNTTGCSSTAQVTIINNLVNPVVTGVVDAHQTICSSGNGQVSASVAGNVTDYTFYWFNGNIATPNIAAPDFTGAVYSGRTAGAYTVVAVDNNTKCQSAKVTVTVNNNTVAPAITTATVNQTSCDTSTPNGQASANVGGVTAGYTFTWYAGAGTSGIIKGNAALATGLAAGVYTVKVDNNTTGCTSTAQVTITDNLVNPVVTAAVDVHQTVCNAGNGQVSASVGGNITNYTFYWFNGNIATPNIAAPDFTGAVYSGRTAGAYTVVAVSNNSKCPSAKATVTVNNNSVAPVITTATVNQTSCDTNTPNGQASANVGGTTTGYTFTWYVGSGTSGAVKGNTAQIINLVAGTYTVKVDNNTTGCSSTAQVTIINNLVNPVVTAAVDAHQTICSAGNGQVSANVAGNVTDYTFYWFNGNIATPNIAAPDFTGAVYNGRTAGAYTVVAVSNATKCQSAKVTVTVNNNTVAPVIATATVNQTSCDTSTPNGQASANVGGVTAGYTFTWYAGAGTSGIIKGNAALATGLAAGVYTVKVDNNATGCSSTAQVTIIDNLVTPIVTAVVDAHQNICSAGNGQVSANVAGNTTDYTFYWFNGNVATPNLAAPDHTGAVYGARTAGTYTVVAVSNNTKCSSARATVTVNDNSVNPVIATATVNQTSCDTNTPNGQASANVGGVTAGYTFAWYAGSGTSGTIKSTTDILTGQPAGVYTVKVVSNATGCSSTAQVTITNNLVNPVVIAAVDAHQTICSAGNGQVSANVAGNTTDYTFYWFNGNIATPNIATPDHTGAVYNGRTAGTYTVVAVDNNTKCQSAKATVTVNDNSVNPVIATATVNQTSCDTSTPNGQASANVGGVTAGYTFTWYIGAGTSGTVKGTGAAINLLAAGTYTVKVVSNATGCSSTAQVTIINNLVNPVVTAVVDAHQTICSAGNGQVSANVAGNTTDYTFYWFNGNIATPNIATPDHTGAVYSGRTAGTYTVVAVDNNTKCQSAKATVTVNDNSVNPVITTATVNQTSCDAGDPNGEASANVGGVTAGYTFTWYAGSGTSGTIKGNTAAITDQPAGVYTVKVVNNGTGCSSTAQVTIINNLVNPVVTAAVDAHQTICSAVNGQVSANVAGNTTDYTFYWFNGNIATPNIATPDHTGATYNGRTAGTYTVVAVDNNTKCQSAKATVTVNDNSVDPVITTATVNQTSCDLADPNGEASANVGGATAGYTFTWYTGAGTSGSVKSNIALATDLAAGTYTVKAVDNATGCSSTAQVTITNNQVNPVVTAVVDAHQTICSAGNGQVSANVAGNTADYTFYWFNGNVASPNIAAANFVGITYIGRVAGIYTVVAVDNDTKCQSAKATVTVLDNTVDPVVTATPSSNTACDVTKSNGSISANVGGVTTNHVFHIFRGQNTLAINEVAGSPAAVVSGLASGIYTVQAIDNATGCAGTVEVTITNNIVLPTITATSADVTNCAPANGSITASVSIGVAGDYTFSWYNGNAQKATPDYATTTNVLSGVGAGIYTVSAVNNVLGCDVQAPFTLNVDNAPTTAITITQLLGERIIPAICNAGTGQLGASASSPVNVAGFDFLWYLGDKNVGMTFEGNGFDFPVNSNRISNAASGEQIVSGLHTVIAVDLTTGCRDSLVINLPYSDEAALLSVLTFPQTNCGAPDGAFDATITPSPGTIAANPTIDQTWYDIRVYQKGVLIMTVDGTVPSTVVSGLAAGNYTILAKEDNPALPGCTSAPNDITIVDNTVEPVITANALIDNKNCTGAAEGTGSIALTVDGTATPAVGYTYAWHEGKFITDPALPVVNVQAPGHTAIDIFGGFYTVQVTNTTNSCKATATFAINDDPYAISIPAANLVVTDQTDCNPVNGSANVTDVLIDGASSGGTAGYTFEWFMNDGVTAIPSSGTTATVGALLAADNYFVKATNTTSNCASPLVQFTVDDNSIPPTITETITSNTNCVGATPNGTITVQINGGAPVADFTIEWFEGNTTTTALGTNVGVVGGANGETASQLPAGTYTIRVTDNVSPGNSCLSTATFTVTDDLPVIAIEQAAITLTHQADCNPADGSAQVTDIEVDGASIGSVAGYTFEWFESDGTTVVASSGSAATIATAIAAGDYFVRATNTASNCSTSLTPFTINNITVNPTIVASTNNSNTNCIGATPNGTITVQINGGAPVADFTIEWFEGNTTTTALGTNVGVVGGANGETASQLPAGIYTVRVTDNVSPGNSCLSTATFTVTDDLPVIAIEQAAIALTHQADCNPADGSAQVTDIEVDGASIGSVAGYTFEWFESDGTTVVASSGSAATIATAIAAGDYFVKATNTASNCSTSLTPFTINNITVNPTIVASTNNSNTNCIGATPNGTITVQINGGAPVADFTIEWFEGNTTTTALGTTVGVVGGANGETASQLPAGTYTVRVTDNISPGNSCLSTATFTVTDDLPVIAIEQAAITLTHQADCNPADGSAQVTDIEVDGISIGSVAGYTFEWFESDGTTVVASSGSAATIATDIAAGDYFVRATNTASNCSTSLTPFTINNITVNPTIVVSTNNSNTNCVGATPNGTITVQINGGAPVADFTIEWFEGNTTTTALGTTVGVVGGANGETASQLPAGTYTVRVTDNVSPGNSCLSTATFTVTDDLPVIAIEQAALTLTHQADCNPADGSAQVTDIEVNGVSIGSVAGYTFEWFESDGTTVVASSGSAATIATAIAAGDYFVRATNTASNCSTSLTPFTINNITVNPTIVASTNNSNTNCVGATPNGTITVQINGGAPVADFTIEWFEGNTTTTALGTTVGVVGGANGETAFQLPAGTYTVRVTDNVSPGNSCLSTATFTVTDDLPVIAIEQAAITLTHQADCNPADGSAQVTDIEVDGISIGSVAGYTFEWFESDGTTVVASSGSAATIATAIAAGDYFVRATNTASNCSTSLTPFTINNITVNPTIVASTNNSNTNCVGATPNGTITVQINGGAPVADFTIEWFEGNTTTTALGTTVGVVGGANGETASQLPAGTYTVRVTDNVSPGNSCLSTATFTVTDDLPVIAIEQSALTLTHQADCNPADGSAQVTDIEVDGVSIGSVAGYTFEWFESDGTTVVASSGSAATIATAIAAGDYFVKATNTASNCSTSLTPFTINNITVNPTIVASTNNSNTNCIGATPNGTITVQINGGAPVADFTIEWFEGNTTTTALGTTVGVVGGANGETASQLPAGTYTVRVTDNVSPGNSCLSTATFTVTDDLPVIAIEQAAITLTHQTDCNPADGSAQVTDIEVDGASIGSVAGYTFEWFESDGTTVVASSGSAATIATAIAAGDYFVRATNTASNCSTSLTPFTINNITVNPTIVASTNNSNTNCVGATPNGTITVQINGGAPVADFTIEWFEGNTTTTALGTNVGVVGGANGETASQLPAGTYTVRVTDNVSPGNSCLSTATFTVTDDLPVIAIEQAAITLTHQADCNPADGSAQVTDIEVDGISIGSVAGYTFEWFESDGTTVVASSGSAATIATAIAAGDYFVRATNTASNCSTSLTPFTINNITVNPTIVASTNNSNTNCVGATPNGTITVQINGGAPVADFTIEWFEGNTTTTALGTTVGVVGGANGETASQLPAGTYTVRVTDNVSPGNSCLSTATFTVTDDLPVIAIEQAAITLTHQADCNPADGSAQVTDIEVDGISIGSVAGYTFEWFESDGTTVVASSGSAATIATAIAAGDYFVKATNTASNCSTSLTPFTINNITVNPTIVASTNNSNTNCVGATPNGTITVQINGGAPVADFTIEWFEGNTTTTALGTTVGVVGGANGETASQLPAGTYTVRVTDNVSPGNSCLSTATFTVTDDLPVIAIEQAALTLTHQADCNPADGSAQVTDIEVDGASIGSVAGYTFEWFENDGTTVVASSGSAATIATAIAAGDYFVRATNTASNCSTSLTPFTINNITVNPTIVASTNNSNTNCVGATPNGTITVQINGGAPVADFTIEWFEGNTTTTALGTTVGVVGGANGETASQLPAGTYTVRVTDNVSPGNSCLSTATFTVTDDLPVIAIEQAAITLTHQADCNPADGSAQVTDIEVDGASIGSVAGYTFEWFESDGTTVVASSGSAATIATAIAAGDYFVRATNTASNCSTSLTPFTINNITVNPTIVASTNNSNTNCVGATPNGTITVQINGGAPVADFTIEWFEGNTTTTALGTTVGVVGGANGETASQLPAGIYTVRVTDNVSPGNSCLSTATFTVTDDLPVIAIEQAAITLTHQADCNPADGSAQVTDIEVDGISIGNVAGYTFEWFESDGTTVVASSGSAATIGTAIGAGNYFVRATNTASNCNTSLTPFTINDISVNPTVVIVQNAPNVACNTSYTGELSASVTEGTTTGVTAGYTFEWFRGANNTNAADFIATGVTLSGMQEGDYTVRVTDVASAGNGCIGIATIYLKREVPVYNNDVTTIAQTQCAPTLDGSIKVTTVRQDLMGTTRFFDMNDPAELADFSFQWFDAAQSPITGVVNGNATSPNLTSGTYYVQSTDNLGCSSLFTIAIIDDNTAPPAISLDAFTNPAVCILPEVTGSLSVIADNNPNFGNYTFAWYQGNVASGAVVDADNELNGIPYTATATYTIRVTNNTTNCFSDATFKFKTDTVTVQTLASATPLTSCITTNGSLFATVPRGDGSLYDYDWYAGSVINGNPVIYTGSVVTIAPMGVYTAIAKHPTLNFCTVLPDTATVTDSRIYPAVNITPMSPLTYCDPAKLNGAANADVNGSIIGYTFDWFEGSISGTPHFTGSAATNLAATTYVVRATDVISGCTGSNSITITADPMTVPVPQVVLVANRTDCEIPNGILSASVNGNISDYAFNWYDGGAVKPTADATGDVYWNLDAGQYAVTAIEEISGCASDPVIGKVDQVYVYPEFMLKTTPALCTEQNGTAELIVLNGSDIQSIEWNINGTLMTGNIIGQLPAGTHTVTAITSLHCEKSETVIVKTEINVYNAVSHNNDGMNDFFEIGCLEEFKNNHVRIFNRAGTLVYEQRGYNNQDLVFNGVSNRGISILGNGLPDGTYFYIIDKGDGSEVKTGYLELLK